jgi:peptidoglycan-associated lipoprotein
VFLVASVAACRTAAPAAARTVSPAPPPAVRPAAPPPASAAAARPTPAAPLSEADIFQRETLDQLNAARPLEDVFFDYDQNILRDDGKRALQQDAQWLATWPSTAIRVDGHCDERGSAEYNLSLGDRRAETVKQYLISLGVKSDRVEIRSLGKEVSFCQGIGESCWSQNRRGHFIITGK